MKILLLLVASLLTIKGFSQPRYSGHATQLQLEFGGPGIFSSLNLDSRFTKKENGPGFRIGVGITPLNLLKDHCNTGSLNELPVGVNYLVGKNNHLLELGVGGVVLVTSGTKIFCTGMQKHFFNEETTGYWFTMIGYRYQPLHKKGLTYRAFVSPLFQKSFSTKLWGGISMGYRF